MSGAKVWGEYQAGNISGIRNYCETDVLNTYCVYLRFELMRGVINPEEYEQSLQNLRVYLGEARGKPHLAEFLSQMAQ